MDTKKDDLLFANPEFIDGRPLTTNDLSRWRHLNLLGILRLFIGHVRNSSGQKDNMLMCVYLSIGIFVAGIWWATHLEVKHTLNTANINKTSSKKTATTKKISRRHPTNTPAPTTPPTTAKKDVTKMNIQINATAPAPLPAAYYYVLFGLVVLFVIAYYARREAGRKFILNLTQAATGKELESFNGNLKTTMMGYVEQAVSKVSGVPTSTSPPTTTETTTETTKTTTNEGGRH